MRFQDLCLIACATVALAQTGAPRVVRVGSSIDSPFASLAADGKPAGFLVEVMVEAARREGYTVEWRFERLLEPAIHGDKVDLWAIAAPSDERRKTIYFTEPWWVEDHFVAVLQSSNIRTIAGLNSKRLAIRTRPPFTRPLAAVLPQVKLVPIGSGGAGLMALCNGEVDAALVSGRSLSQPMPEECPPATSLRWIPLDAVVMEMSVASHYRDKELASRFRHHIGEMFLDGTVARIAQRHPVQSSRTAQSLVAQAENEYQRRTLRNTRLTAAAVILSLIGALAWSFRATTRERAARDEARRLSGQILRVQDEERRRMARELHDGVAQQVAAVGINMTLLKSKLEAGEVSEAVRLAEDSRDLATSCGRELRSTTYLLHPPILEDLGLEPAIRSFTEGYMNRSGVQVDVDIQEDLGRLPPDIEATIFRIMQEALANVQRHSGSKHAKISLRRKAGEIELVVRDYGTTAAESAEAPKFGVGILGMEERVRQFGGRFDVRFGEDGTRVRSVLPA